MRTINIFIVSFLLILVLTSYFYRKRSDKPSQQRKSFKVAILTKNGPFFEKVHHGILHKKNQYNKATFDLKFFYTEGMNRTLCKAMIEQALEEKPDLIITIGVTFSQLCKNTLEKRKINIPMVFLAQVILLDLTSLLILKTLKGK